MSNKEYSSSERERIINELGQSLGPEYIAFKTGHAYIEGHNSVTLANEIFGFDGWSSEIRKFSVDFSEEKGNRHSVGIHCIMRVTLRNGMSHEDIGFGNSINMPSKSQAFEKAYKEAATDALKRALRQFGDALGNCIYNKDYVGLVRQLKPEKLTFDTKDLRRPLKRPREENHPRVAPPQMPQIQAPPPVQHSGMQYQRQAQPQGGSRTVGAPAAAKQNSRGGFVSAGYQSTPNEPVPLAFPDSDDSDDAPPALESEMDDVHHGGDGEIEFTTGAGYDGDESAHALAPFDTSRTHISNSKLPQDVSTKTYRRT